MSNEASRLLSVSELLIIRTSHIHRVITTLTNKTSGHLYYPCDTNILYTSFVQSFFFIPLYPYLTIHIHKIPPPHTHTRSLTHLHTTPSAAQLHLAWLLFHSFVHQSFGIHKKKHQPLPFIRLSIDHTEFLIVLNRPD